MQNYVKPLRKRAGFLTVLALSVVLLSSCANGVKSNLIVSNEFLEEVEQEISAPVPCIVDEQNLPIAEFEQVYPAMMQVLFDWIAQNEPEDNQQ